MLKFIYIIIICHNYFTIFDRGELCIYIFFLRKFSLRFSRLRDKNFGKGKINCKFIEHAPTEAYETPVCARVVSRRDITIDLPKEGWEGEGKGPRGPRARSGSSSIGSRSRDRSAIDGPNIGTPELFLCTPSMPPKKK